MLMPSAPSHPTLPVLLVKLPATMLMLAVFGVLIALGAGLAAVAGLLTIAMGARAAVPWSDSFFDRYADPTSLLAEQLVLGLRDPASLFWRIGYAGMLILGGLGLGVLLAYGELEVHDTAFAIGTLVWSTVLVLPSRAELHFDRVGWVYGVLWLADGALVAALLVHAVNGAAKSDTASWVLGAGALALADLIGVAFSAWLSAFEDLFNSRQKRVAAYERFAAIGELGQRQRRLRAEASS